MKAIVLALALIAAPSGVAAQSVSGPATAIDGDSLDLTGVTIRLWGIDAPEAAQSCQRGGEDWACGREAHSVLQQLVTGSQVECDARDSDAHGRIVASCRAGRIDLAQALVGAGLAIALPDVTDSYVADQSRAESLALGIWAGAFATPATFRAANPELAPRPPQRIVTVDRAATAPPALYFANCAQARAAGKAPIRRGEPGYRPPLDRDNDGIACEPYRR